MEHNSSINIGYSSMTRDWCGSHVYRNGALERIEAVDYEEWSGRLMLGNEPDYSCIYGYDLNGNITSLTRHGVDRKAEDYSGTSPYAYCAANPIRYIDPTGMNPVYDRNGIYFGNRTGTHHKVYESQIKTMLFHKTTDLYKEHILKTYLLYFLKEVINK